MNEWWEAQHSQGDNWDKQEQHGHKFQVVKQEDQQ
jgi:hypothetical protein